MDKQTLLEKLYASLEAITTINEAGDELLSAKKEIEDAASTAKSMERATWSIILFDVIWLFVSRQIYISFLKSAPFLVAFFFVVGPMILMAPLFQRKGKSRAIKYRQEILLPLQQAFGQKYIEFEQVEKSENVQILQDTVPPDYSTIDAVEFFIAALENQRADTLKEAINLYEDQLHRDSLMQTQEKIIELSQQSVDLSQEIAQNQKKQIRYQQKQIRNQEKLVSSNRAIMQKTKKISKQVRFSNAMGLVNTVKHWNDKKK